MRKKNNSIKQIIDTLRQGSFMTENEIMRITFGYNRNMTWESNKKYADMLRRGLDKGIIKRVRIDSWGREKYFYYLPEQERGIVDLVRRSYIKLTYIKRL